MSEHKKPTFTFIHMGLNTADNDEATKLANQFSTFFGYENRELPKSIFASDAFEIMRFQGMGAHGHIALGVDNMAEAIDYLTEQGATLDYETARRDDDGNITFIYLADDFAGFRIHLLPNV